MNKKYKSFLTGLGIGAVITIAVIYLNRGQDYSLPQRLSDGFFVSAVILLGFGGLVFVRNKGAFDMMAYSIKTTFRVHYPGSAMGSPREREEFPDYQERKKKGRKSSSGTLIAGLVYLVLASVMLITYFFV